MALSYLTSLLLLASAPATQPSDSVADTLQEVVVSARPSNLKLRNAGNTELITSADLKRAACCNLGESFTTNPSVDVSYNDAATGARQIRLLGLSGTYVQMLTENVPNFRGAASPFGLGYLAGPWLQSIQVSKGASSVKNGFESITGQINIEMKKPQTYPSLSVNAYADHEGKTELNFDGNLHLGDKWSGAILLHGENNWTTHDANGDTFADMPRIRQITAANRWAYLGRNYVFQAFVKALGEKRSSGQIVPHSGHHITNPYTIDISTVRAEAFTKNAYIFDPDNDGNVAIIASANLHDMKSEYGLRRYDVLQRDVYVSAMFERKWNSVHALSTGLSFLYDNYHQILPASTVGGVSTGSLHTHEAIPGVYAQYTLNLDNKLIAMAGIREDYSSLYGWMTTPRLHIRYNIIDPLSIQFSAGRGYHSPHPYAEFSYLLASSRRIEVAPDLRQESAWNLGGSVQSNLQVADRPLKLSAEYYYTTFANRLVADLDTDPHAAILRNLHHGSYSHTFQAEATYDIINDLTFMAAYRLTDVKADYGNGPVQMPLTSRHKGLFTLTWSPMMAIWQVDLSCSVNGAGRNPTPFRLADGAMSWTESYPTYALLNAQITRNFKHWSVYVGGENLTNYKQKNPIVGASDPFGPDFDATVVHAPLHGITIYIGFRYNLTKY